MPRRLHPALAPLIVAALGCGAASASQPAPDVSIGSTSPAAVERLRDITTRTLTLLEEWLGPRPQAPLSVVDLRWGAGVAGESRPGSAATRVRWLTPERDATAERALIAALARQFWFTAGDAPDPWFREGLVVYSATRAIHALLEGRNFETPRFLDGFVPIPLRSLQLSPNMLGGGAHQAGFEEVLQPPDAPWRFAAVHDGTPARRAAAALRTLDRLIGWPSMQQALAAARERAAGGAVTPEAFAGVVAEQRGDSMEWFVRDLLRSTEVIDYAVGGVTSERVDDLTRTAIRIDRRGSGVFSGTDRPRSAGPARSIGVLVRFSDGSEVRTQVDGREQQSEIAFESYAQPVAAAIDPDEIVLVDTNRMNNVWAPDPPRGPIGLRLVASWLIWLQHAMLTYTAIA